MKLLLKLLFIASPMLAVFVFHYTIGMGLSLYQRWPSFDIFMHTLGGFVTAWSAWILFRPYERAIPRWVFWSLVIGAVSFVSIVWEWYEFTHDVLYPMFVYQPSIRDTMVDFWCDIVGAVFFCLGILVWKRK